MKLEVGNIYRSLAGCPVKLLELVYEGEGVLRLMAKVEYVDEENHYGYGKGSVSWFYARDLSEWTDTQP